MDVMYNSTGKLSSLFSGGKGGEARRERDTVSDSRFTLFVFGGVYELGAEKAGRAESNIGAVCIVTTVLARLGPCDKKAHSQKDGCAHKELFL